MKLTQLIVRRPISALVMIIAVVLFGFMSMTSMDQELIPEMNMPMMIISTPYVGAGPEDIDKQVTGEIEGSIGTLSGVKKIMSQSMENMSLVIIQYEYGTDMDKAYVDLMGRVNQLGNTLPSDAGTPIIVEMDMNAASSMTLSIHSDTQSNLRNYVEDEIVPEFEKLSAVADVTISGGREEYIRVELREDKLRQYGLSMGQIVNCLGAADFSMPVGDVTFGQESRAVRSQVEYRTLEALRNMPISLGGGAIIRLEDVANIYDAYKDVDSASRYNGQDTISIGLTKRQSESAATLSKQAMAVIDSINKAGEVGVDVVNDSSDTISSSINSVLQTLLLAIFISMVVLYLFLGDWKASLIVGSSMPVSLLITFILMNFMGFSMNIITLSSMVIGVGMMVDNSIVVIDSCFRFQDEKRSLMDSAVEGTKFVLFSIVGGTLTTVVVFLPLAVISGISGQLFKPLGFTIVFSLLASLLSAITLVPLFFVQFKPREKESAPAARLLRRLEEGYGNLLRKLLPKKKTVIAVAVAFLAVSLLLATQLDVELMGSMDEGIVQISVDTRPGLLVEEQDAIVRTIEEMVAAHPDVERYSVSVGGSALMGSSNTVTAYLRDDRALETDEVIEQWRQQTRYITDCSLDISSASTTMASMGGDTVEVNLKGDDLAELRAFSREVEELMRSHPDMITVSSNFSDGNPQIEVVVDPLKAAAYSLTAPEVASNIGMALNGAEAVEINRDGQKYSVRVEYPKGRYETANDLEGMIVTSATGARVPLADIASFQYTNAPQTIVKEDNQYIVTITGAPRASVKFDVEKDIAAQVEALSFPEGITPADSTMQEMMDEEFASLFGAIFIAVVLVFMVMAIQFESIRYSVMVMLCIPFSMIGSFTFLFLSNSTISMISLMGFLILVGTVVNNGILFVDTTNEYRKTMSLTEALVNTGKHRLRPILMTTLTTVLSMVPLALGVGEGGELMQSMGLTVIGGLAASTILTLLFLPTFYLILDRNKDKRNKKGKDPEPSHTNHR